MSQDIQLIFTKGLAGDGATKISIALFFDEKAKEHQRSALNMIFGGKAGGFVVDFAKLIEVHGVEYALIKFEVADDLANWSVEIPGKVLAGAEASTGPMTSTWEKSSDYCNMGEIFSG